MNSFILLMYRFLAAINFVPKSLSEKNRRLNEWHVDLLKRDSFIEDQNTLSCIKIGKKDIAFCGCGVVAVYNILLSIKKRINPSELFKIVEAFEKKGLAVRGHFGISPVSIRKYLENSGFNVIYTASDKAGELDDFGNKCSKFICTIFHNNKSLKSGIHHIAVIKNSDGRFETHNPYRVSDTLSGAIKSAAMYNGSALYTIGIKNNE